MQSLLPKILVLHGPNLNTLGDREVDCYGKQTLVQINQQLELFASTQGYECVCEQYNAEHEIIDAIHRAKHRAGIIVINAAAFTHTSIAIRDALLSVALPFIEVHMTNIFAREAFRHVSYLSDCAVGCIVGFGAHSYTLGLQAAIDYLKKSQQ